MKLYYYFLFRLYWSFRDFSKEGHKMSLISTSIISALFVYFTLFTIIELLYFYKLDIGIDLGEFYKFWIILIGFILWLLNYLLFIKPRNFLRQDFRKDKKGGIILVFVIVILGGLFIFGANKNREKIFREKERERVENLK